jgi:hypothetical protein
MALYVVPQVREPGPAFATGATMSTDPNDEIVRLATAPNPAQAHIWEQALRDAGIKCKVVGDYLNAGIGDVPGIQAEIWVHRGDVERADEVLRESQPELEGEKDVEET